MKRFRKYIAEAPEKKQFYQVKFKEVVKALGNKWKTCKDSQCIYIMMTDIDRALTNMYFRKYHEVSSADTTDMMDWADSHAPAPDVNGMIKKEDKNLFKIIMDKKKELQAKKWKGEKEEAAQMKTLIQRFMDKKKIYGLEAGFVLDGFWK